MHPRLTHLLRCNYTPARSCNLLLASVSHHAVSFPEVYHAGVTTNDERGLVMNNRKRDLTIILLVSCFVLTVFSGCANRQEAVNEGGNVIKNATKQLVAAYQKDQETTSKEFTYEGQKFTIALNAVGHPVFIKDGKQVEEIGLKVKEVDLKIRMVSGMVQVEAK